MKTVLLSFLILASCNYRTVKGAGDADVSAASLASVDFATVQKIVLGPKCIRCHGDQGGLSLGSLAEVKSALPRINTRALVNQTMPPNGPLTSAEASVLNEWIKRGAPEFANAEAVATSDTWETMQVALFDKYCVTCHSSPAPEAHLDLTSLNEVRANSARIFARVVVNQDMPLAPFPKPTSDEKKRLAYWIVDGLP